MAPWSAEEDRKLFLAIINLTQVTPNWDEVGTQLGRTGESIRQRYQKLKKEAANSDTATGDGSAPAATPRKTAKRKTPKKKAADDDDDDEEGTPLTKRARNIKSEPKDDEQNTQATADNEA